MNPNFHPDNTRLITGTFMQLDHWDDGEGVRFQEDMRRLTPDHWRLMLQNMAAIGIDTLVFQQSFDVRNGLDDIRAYYPSRHWPVPEWMKSKPTLYDEVIDEAERLGMKVVHSIYSMYAPDPYVHSAEALKLATIAASELYERYGNRPSFAGWYWTYEYPPTVSSGRDSLKAIVPAIRQIAECDFMIAPNLDWGMCPAVLQDIDVDIIAYQDSVGIGVEPDIFCRCRRGDHFERLSQLHDYYKLLKFFHDGWTDKHRICDEQIADNHYWNFYTRSRGRTKLWNDLEVWEFNCRKELLPAQLSRVTVQLDRSAPYVDKQIIYQYPGLMCHPDHPIPVGGERAITLYEDYALYREAVLAGRR